MSDAYSLYHEPWLHRESKQERNVKVNQNHCMVDLETLGTNEDAVIVAIGAVVFDPFTPGFVVPHRFHQVVQLNGQPNRKMDTATVAWWMKQSDAARQIFEYPDTTLTDALNQFYDFYTRHQCIRIWSHGITFDVAILNHAYRNMGRSAPWSFRDARDTRTIYDLYPNQTELKTFFKHTHNALQDAEDQARALHHVFQFRKGLAQ